MKYGPAADKEATAIIEQITAICMARDSRLVAPILGTLAARMYQGLMAAGLHTEQDTRECMQAFADIALSPPEKAPGINHISKGPSTRQ